MKDRKRNSEENKEWVGPIYYSQHPNLKKLTPLEKKYLLAVEHGDAATVRRILMMKKRDASMDLDVNCKDPVGRSAMLMAIDNENLEMLQILIEFDVETSDALLHAINAEFVEAVELLLDHEEATHKDGEPHSWEKVDEDISAYTSEITPLILAAHKDNYEILKILLDRGATLPMPHDVRCPCNECAQALKEDCLCHSRSRINAYRALSSPSLICLSSIDPILTAFELSWELRRLSRAENEFKEDYQKLRIRCQDFATSLLAQTRSSRELGVILTHDPITPPPQDVETLPLTRVEMALKYKQKKFIAHPNVQQLMSTLWYDGLPGFRQLNLFQQLWVITKIGILFPFYSVLYMLSPHSETGKLIRKPFFKFILHSFSYLFFLFLLILASQRVETVLVQLFGTERMRLELLETLKKQRGQPPTVIETSILVFIIAHVWQETRELWKKGLINYFQNMWNVIDFTRNLLHVSTAGLRLLAYIQAQSEIRDNPMAVFIPREAWDAFDPTLIADGLFAAGNVFAALKLVHIFSINPYLGPLQISLGRMIIDIIKFFFIYTLVLFAFACGLNQLLWYYADMEKKQCFSGPGGTENWLQQRDSCLAWRRFSNLFESSQTLFWATFGLVDLSNFELTGIKSYTRFWGLLMFGSYSVINVVVLLNLLIAMMSNSYQIISERADEEWKFARTKLFMNYFEEGCTVPPPFNIFPTFKNIMRLFDKKSNRKSMSIRKKQNKLKERESIYQNVMCNLVWRYVTTQQKARECDAVTEDHINEVRQDLSSFRHDLMHILRCNGMNTRGVDLRKTDVTPGKIQVRKRRLIKDFSIGLMEVCAEDAAPEVRTNKGVLARLVGLSSTDTGTCQRWRELIQLAKKSKMIGKESPGVSREASTVSEDTNETQQTGGDMEKVRVQGQNAPDIAPSKAEMQDKQITVTKLNEPNGCPPNITEEKTQVDMVTLSKGVALCAKSLLQSSAVDDAPKQGSPQKRPPSLYPQLSMEGRTKEATDRVQKSVTFETPPKCAEGKSSASGSSGKRSKTLAPSPPQRSTETPADGCTRRELPPSPGPKHAPQLPPDMKPLIDLSDVGMTSVAIDVPADSPRAASRKNDNTRSSAQEKSVVVSILNSTESGTASDVKSQKRSDGAKSAIPIPQRKPRADDTKGAGSTPPSDVEGYRHGWI